MKPVILSFIQYYLPGYRAGGPLRTMSNMVDRLGDEFVFKIITCNRDDGIKTPYPVSNQTWNSVGKAKVLYSSTGTLVCGLSKKLLNSIRYDILYLNSFFSPAFSIQPLLLSRLRLHPKKPAIVAPRGEFSPRALSLKRRKKQIYMKVSSTFAFYRNIVWQASSTYEAADIRRYFNNNNTSIIIASDIPEITTIDSDMALRKHNKQAGCLKLLYLSRISPMKNLDGALRILMGVKGKVVFNIYGPIGDAPYWQYCRSIISSLPANISVEYMGPAPHDRVLEIMSGYDLFFLPTHGENFGHVIVEALSAGCPVLISDQTPWRGIQEKGIGWDLSLDDVQGFKNVIAYCIAMDGPSHRRWVMRALEFAQHAGQDGAIVEQNRALFYSALGPC